MKINKNIAISESGMLFNPVSGESFTVNPIGAEILALLKENLGEDEIREKILEKYNTDRTTFSKDFQDFTGMLNHFKLTDPHGEEKA